MKISKTTVFTLNREELERVIGKAFIPTSHPGDCKITETRLNSNGEIEVLTFTAKEEASL